MNRNQTPSDDPLENDAVWDLIDRVRPAAPSASFADQVVRMAKLEPMPLPWWKNWRVITPSLGLAATAAVALAFVVRSGNEAPVSPVAVVPAVEEHDGFAEIQEFAETETLIAAADHLEDFSDQELVGLIGF